LLGSRTPFGYFRRIVYGNWNSTRLLLPLPLPEQFILNKLHVPVLGKHIWFVLCCTDPDLKFRFVRKFRIEKDEAYSENPAQGVQSARSSSEASKGTTRQDR
jgi:hypothetical protein